MLLNTYTKVTALKNVNLRNGFKSGLYVKIDWGGSGCWTVMSVKVVQWPLNRLSILESDKSFNVNKFLLSDCMHGVIEYRCMKHSMIKKSMT